MVPPRFAQEREMAKTGLELLEEIKPAVVKKRFLQHWDRDLRVLRFGCGDERNGVWVGSDFEVIPAEGPRPTKLQSSLVRALVAGNADDGIPLDHVAGAFRDYVHLPDFRVYSLLSVWIMGTYVCSMFSHFGYMFLHSAMPRCGKTRAEEVTSHLAFEATTPRNAPTPPSMRETAVEGGTAIFDTLERWKEKSTESYAAAMEILDAGFRNGGTLTKMVGTGDGNWRLENYPVYAPYMFAAIDAGSLTDTARDRSFQIAMVRKSTRTKTLPYDPRCEATCAPIREMLYSTALRHAARIADAYESRDLLQLIDSFGLNDRAADIWRPLLAISTALDQPAFTEDLVTLAQEMSPDPDRAEERRQLAIVSALRTIAGPEGTIAGTTQQLITMIRGLTGIEYLDLHSVLSGWGFSERSIRLRDFDTPRRAWELTDEALAGVERTLR
jgi:hypothetical protein